ncbi:RagB/SusD family nutrient uptake outer membrane protein [Aridibaculum aurantiacum]|uniref:RagB/SusD family nutrient uptake outer membrane protein n=1 Tax=Aridibaculum aurantiacum TaxID=2810307 RepID=UPI001A975FD0|nr:RagB/SusD family nutrient uptake outer membrane protein [Aridibaculum aurantiacum]
MKKVTSIKYLIGLVIPVMFATGCKKEFLEKPPTSAIVDAGFYQTDAQVMAGTASLYNRVWFDYNDKAYYNLGDFRAGTAFSAWNDRGNVLFNTTGDNGENGAAWRAFFNVVAQSNLTINNINKYAGAGVSPSVKATAIAEARFMRAVAYRFLVSNWGEVPVIENNLELLTDTSLRKHTVPSIWRFITREMRAVAENLPTTASQPGRITRWSAEGMLARFYLTRAGVEATGPTGRKQEFLDSAKYYAQRVITNSGAQLLPNYENLFKFPYDNNRESLFELQWVFAPGSWGFQNTAPAYLNYGPDIANGDGWGGDKGATWWMFKQYEGFTASGDTMLRGRTLDQRLKATYMLPGAHYPEITQTLNGVDQRLIFPYVAGDVNFASIKKYVVGKAEDVGGEAASQNYPNNTYMLRLAEMYLIYAEAVLGNSASTTDATALEYFNKVHTRAGLPAETDPLTFDMIFRERILEFAMEGMAWYDFVSLHYYNPQKAYSILNEQDRGYYNITPDAFPNPTMWTIKKTTWHTTERQINANAGNFRLPIPNVELSQAPNLNKPAVDYP